jgi:hypothetical protein
MAELKLNAKLEGEKLVVDLETSGLDAYRWDAPENIPVIFLFVAENVHVITLDEGERPPSEVRSHNEICQVKMMSDEDVAKYASSVVAQSYDQVAAEPI